jgi:hypothetical protein
VCDKAVSVSSVAADRDSCIDENKLSRRKFKKDPRKFNFLEENKVRLSSIEKQKCATEIKSPGDEMTKEAVLSEAAIMDREPTDLHKNFVQWIEEETGYKADLKSVQIAASLRIKFQRSELNQADLAARKERSAAELIARQERKAAAEAKLAEKADEVKVAKVEKVAKKETAVKKEAAEAKKPAPKKTRTAPKSTAKPEQAAALEETAAPAPVKKTAVKSRATRKPAAK